MNKRLWFSSLIFLLVLCCAICRFSASAQVASVVPAVSTNLVGSSVALSVFTDVDLPYLYQWTRDGTNLIDAGTISGSQTATLSLSNLQLTDTATYVVRLTYTNTLLATAPSTVYVVEQPTIQSIIPVSQGDKITFTATATGGLLSYQWIWQGQELPGATSSVLSFNDAYNDASAGVYSLFVTNPAGTVAWSGPGFLFTKPTPSGTYQGIFFDTNSVVPESSGFFQYTLAASKRSFSGKLSLGANTYPFSGVFSATHESAVEIARTGTNALSLHLQLVSTNDAPLVVGTATDGHWLAILRGNKLYYSSKVRTALAGKYTLSLLNTNTDQFSPGGSGYGLVTVQSNGMVTLSGKAGDGTKISQSCGLARSGDWPFYVSMFKGRGRLIGWLNVSKQVPDSIRGDAVAWVKTPGPDTLHPGGFGETLQPVGSKFVKSSPILSFTNGVAALSGGDLFFENIPIWNFIKVVRKSNSFTPEQSTDNLKLAVNSSGIISGQFIDPLTGMKAPIQGIVLQKQGYFRGYFLSTNTCGAFTLTPGTP